MKKKGVELVEWQDFFDKLKGDIEILDRKRNTLWDWSYISAHIRKSTAHTRAGNCATIRFTEVLTRHRSDYIQIRSPVYLSHSAGRYAAKRFRKAQCPIIERLTNSLMMNGRNNGKKLLAVRIVAHAFEIVCATPTNSTIPVSNSDN
jgi:predicted DsbA family dithiol-disulfide isomerase